MKCGYCKSQIRNQETELIRFDYDYFHFLCHLKSLGKKHKVRLKQ